MTMPVIELRGVSRRCDDGPPALDDVSLTVRAGEASRAINSTTVLKAYQELEHEGLVAARPGVGTFVTATLTDTSLAAHGPLLLELQCWLAKAAGPAWTTKASRLCS